MPPKALYLHIPFCANICSYCDFTKLIYNDGFSFSYLKALKEEFVSYNIDKVETIYIGGGTPTSLRDDEFEDVLKLVSPHLERGGEFTVEANPESLSDGKIALMKKYGVNRVSIGMQSTDKRLLEIMNRHHDFTMVKDCIKRLKDIGLNNINVDLIYGFKEESREILNKDLEALISLDVPHISTYSLSIPFDSIFYKKGYRKIEEEEDASCYEYILSFLRKHGYKRYEVSNFSKPGFESAHNKIYWKNEEYYGLGLGASGYINKIRYKNTNSLKLYCQGRYIQEEEKVEKKDEIEYFFITNLRLEDGFEIKHFIALFGEKEFDLRKEKFNKLIGEGLLRMDGVNIAPTDKGIMLLDLILRELI